MAKVNLVREHNMNYEDALKLAEEWKIAGESDFDLEFTSVEEDEQSKNISFKRKGLNGFLIVTAEQFKLELTLGFLFSAYKEKIVTSINKNMDELL